MISASQQRDVYLPPGEWVDWWSGDAVGGGVTLRVAPPLTQLPLWVRRDALLPVTAPAVHLADGPWAQLTLLSFGGGDAVTEIRDDGCVSTVAARRDGDTLSVTIAGPARVTAIAFPTVAGGTPPATVLVNDEVQRYAHIAAE